MHNMSAGLPPAPHTTTTTKGDFFISEMIESQDQKHRTIVAEVSMCTCLSMLPKECSWVTPTVVFSCAVPQADKLTCVFGGTPAGGRSGLWICQSEL